MSRRRFAVVPVALAAAVIVAVLSAIAAVSASSQDHYAAPGGRAGAAGSADDPWDLATALSGAEGAIAAGDTVWLAAGVYSGAFTSSLPGTSDAPIVVRALPGARATLDGAGFSDPVLTVKGAWTTFQDLEITNSDPSRPAVKSSRPTGVAAFAPGSKFVHLYVHDAGQGFGFWSEAPDSEIYGCVIYHNGATTYDHGIYVQNRDGGKRMVDNVIFQNAGAGIHAYGTSAASLANLWIEGNAVFDNGVLVPDSGDGSANLVVGGGAPVRGLRVYGNSTWTRELHDTTASFGSDTPSVDAIVQGNRFVGFVDVVGWAALSMSGNAFTGSTTLVRLETTLGLPSPFLGWDDNRYVSGETEWQPFSLTTSSGTRGFWYPDWQAATGSDANSEYTVGPPTGVDVVVRPSRYEPGRATVIAYDWNSAPSVSADLSGTVEEGARYEIRTALDPFGPAVAAGVYAGGEVSIPMRARPVASPAGLAAPATTAPQFDVFLVTSGAAPTPTPTATPGPRSATPTPSGGSPPAEVTPRRPPKSGGS
jgi:hypothetical protein